MNQIAVAHPLGRWATATAQRDAEVIGLQPTETDWRDVFLAITQAAIGGGGEARFRGASWRDREVWEVVLCGAAVRAVYAPDDAIIIALLPPPRAEMAQR